MFVRGCSWGECALTEPSADGRLAAESAASYDAAAWEESHEEPAQPASLEDALASLAAGIDALAAVDLAGEDDRALLHGIAGLERLASRLASGQLDLLAAADRRGAYGAEAAVTMASWYRAATGLDHGEATRRVHAATRLRHLPLLAAALAAGQVTLSHVSAVTEAAVPNRLAAIAAVEEPLVVLARRAGPRQLRVALRRVVDQVDP